MPAALLPTPAAERRAAGTGRVVTETRRREAGLKTGALQTAILNSANFSSIATDEKGVIQIFNVGAERMLGYAADDVMNKITPAEISDPQELIARAKALSVELGTPITPGFEALVFKASRGIEDIYELTYIRKDGSRFPAIVSVTALRDAQNAIIGYLLIGTDNTARKQIEAEQKRLENSQRKDGSYAFVQDRGYILRDAAGAAIRLVGGMRDLTAQKEMEAQCLRALRMESIGTLAGGIAHDLNNVLAPIMMSIELLKLGVGHDPRLSKILDSIYANSRRGADLVRRVLSFARGLDGQRVAIQLRHLVSELVGIIGETFPRNIRIVAEVPNDLWPITGDPTQLHQVLLNLAVNARDAMPHGGTLTLTAVNLTIDAQFGGMNQEAKAGPHVLLQVTDTGLGMPPEVRERIFEPFFTTKELGQGTGIGLATVHTVVKSHRGFVSVESEVGRGTTFKIYLPADPTLRAEDPVSVPIELPRGQNELILVVDDEFTILDITQQTLEAFGYRVITASDGAEAVALYAKQGSDIAVVLTDMMMPIMDGAATIQVLLRIDPAVKIIATCGIDSGDTVARAGNAGVKHFLLKPYTAETLLKLFREVLDRSASPAAR